MARQENLGLFVYRASLSAVRLSGYGNREMGALEPRTRHQKVLTPADNATFLFACSQPASQHTYTHTPRETLGVQTLPVTMSTPTILTAVVVHCWPLLSQGAPAARLGLLYELPFTSRHSFFLNNESLGANACKRFHSHFIALEHVGR